jgi:hypothetical protein
MVGWAIVPVLFGLSYDRRRRQIGIDVPFIKATICAVHLAAHQVGRRPSSVTATTERELSRRAGLLA